MRYLPASFVVTCMPDFEQVCRRLFSDSAWLGKCLLGAVLTAIPVLNFFAFGYLGRIVAATAEGDWFDLPEWSDAGSLFVSGVAFFVIFLGLGGGLFLLAGLLCLPFLPWAGPLAYVPLIPAFLLAPPFVGAGWYRYCRMADFVEAFRLPELFRLMQDAWFPLVLPTLAYLGFLFACFPLFPLAFFVGGIVVFFYYTAIFRRTELRQFGPKEAPFSVL